MVYFKGEERKAISQYDEIQGLLTQKYGKPSDDNRLFIKPYYKGDGYETQAIRLGKAFFVSIWWFPIEEGKADAGRNGILLQITDKVTVSIQYENGPRQKRWSEKQKQKNADDL